MALVAFVGALFIVYRTLVYGNPVAGYPSLMVTLLFLSGVQLIGLGIVGEYLGRMFNEAKRRPLYFMENHLPATQDVHRPPGAPLSSNAENFGKSSRSLAPPRSRVHAETVR